MTSEEGEFEYCGIGPCAAPAGHEGTCIEASGWDEKSFEDEIGEAIAHARLKKRRWRIWQQLADENARLRSELARARALELVARYKAGRS